MSHTLSRRVMAPILMALLLSALTVASTLATPPSDIGAARAATARYNSLNQALDAGYGLLPVGAPLHDCIMALDGSGGMGFHFVNFELLADPAVDPTTPEVLVYAPDKNGKLRLVALEYVVFQADWEDAGNAADPALFGHAFHETGAPNRYEIPAFFALHVWLWEENPVDMFADFNPNVSCN